MCTQTHKLTQNKKIMSYFYKCRYVITGCKKSQYVSTGAINSCLFFTHIIYVCVYVCVGKRASVCLRIY